MLESIIANYFVITPITGFISFLILLIMTLYGVNVYIKRRTGYSIFEHIINLVIVGTLATFTITTASALIYSIHILSLKPLTGEIEQSIVDTKPVIEENTTLRLKNSSKHKYEEALKSMTKKSQESPFN